MVGVVLTGASGFIGKHLCAALAGRFSDVRALTRQQTAEHDLDFLRRLGITLHQGDITDRESLSGAFQKDDTVLHLAGLLGGPSVSEEQLEGTNVLGTRNVVGAAKKAGIRRIIFLSSAGVYGPRTDARETDPVNPSTTYEGTKARAEREVIKSGLDYVILRPEFVYGPMDEHVLPLFSWLSKRPVFVIGNGQSLLHPTYVDDVVQCVLAVLDKEPENAVINIAGERSVSVEGFYSLILASLNRKARKYTISLSLANLAAALNRGLSAAAPVPLYITPERMRFLTRSRSIDCSRARQLLRYKPTPLSLGIRRTVEWYKGRGLL